MSLESVDIDRPRSVNDFRAAAFSYPDNCCHPFRSIGVHMSQPRSRVVHLLAISILTLGLAGCVVAVDPPHRYYVGEAVAVAPPPPQVEVYGAPPGPGFVWLGGFWRWEG